MQNPQQQQQQQQDNNNMHHMHRRQSSGGSDQQPYTWSTAILVLRQNYLLEYDCPEDDDCEQHVDVEQSQRHAIPRGYAHLQYAECREHTWHPDALELHYYASPCAKADKRVLMSHTTSDERS